MAQFLTPGVLQIEAANGFPVDGAQLFVFEVGTTTEVPLFSDEALTTPISNPLVAGADGVLPAAFMDETRVKLVCKDDDDVTLWTREVIYTTGVASNIPASGVSFNGTTSGLAADNVQSAIDEVVELQGLTQTWETSSDGTIATGTSTNAGANAGPDLDLYRNSASPAASDLIGGVILSGKSASGSKQTYAVARGVITDPSNGSEDGKLVVQTVVAGAVGDRVHVGAGVWGNGATGGDPGAGNANFNEVRQNGTTIRPLVSATSQPSTSGTAIDFTSIPSWAKRVSIIFAGVNLSGSDDFLIQIGDSGGIETTGYVSDGSSLTATSQSTTGFVIRGGGVLSGRMDIDFVTGNQWASGHIGATSGGTIRGGGGSKTLSDTLDRVRITRSGTNTFNAGAINIHYE